MVLLKRRLISIFFCWLVLSPQLPVYANTKKASLSQEEAVRAAEVLNIRAHVERFHSLINESGSSGQISEDALLLKSLILRKILRAVLEIRQACNKIDLELAFTYDIMRREERRQQFNFELFNLANFTQISTFYTLEPWVRIHKYFNTSAVFTTVSGSLGITISSLSRLYGAVAKAGNVSPPRAFAELIDGKPVDTEGMPPLVTRFLDSQAPDSKMSYRDQLFATWKSRYHIDASNKENLCGIAGKKKASLKLLNSRILLLWSLHTYVQNFDQDLLALLKSVEVPINGSSSSSDNASASLRFSPGALEVMRLLNIRSQGLELAQLQQSGSQSLRRTELELLILERALEGTMEVQVASDKVDDELYYNYHIALSDLLASRAKWLQYNYNLNFLQSGIMGVVAGRLYLRHFTYAGDKQFVISGGIGTGLTGLAIMQMHGFWRKVDSPPNSLAEILDLHPAVEYRFSPFVSSFLNSPPPESPSTKTRREMLNEEWINNKVTTMKLASKKNREALADMPSHKYDTINVVTNRTKLLHSLKHTLEHFQDEMLGLLSATGSDV